MKIICRLHHRRKVFIFKLLYSTCSRAAVKSYPTVCTAPKESNVSDSATKKNANFYLRYGTEEH